ncbi:hypothetical protein RB601_007728 [Gaeumannomyces tritici]
MARNRVLSFVSQFSGAHLRDSRTPTPNSSPPNNATKPESGIPPLQTSLGHNHGPPDSAVLSPTPSSPARPEFTGLPLSLSGSPTDGVEPRTGRQRSSSRPQSMIQTYHPPIMDVTEETIPELQPIFTLLNNHSNKLYQEGYFLKLDDQNAQGRPNPDRTWTECFAQLVGTVLSLWDAAELDSAGDNGEVLPKFINLTDASIKMIESLPTRSNDEQPLQNILSISTAGRNRYLLHFNSHHSLIQWTAGIRLAIFEHSTLQEAYTGALIAGKGKTLNGIGVIMERARVKSEDWVRVRFGAGVPWRRCWCVISPPDEKEYQKQQKDLKKRSPYDRSPVPILKGDIKFYDTRKDGKKQKKGKPIASISDAYAAYAIYPQAKSLIDASTLLKVEGNITIHSDPPSSTEGFVFIMPEVHPAVSGFEMLLRYMFPTWDTFGLYGRPGRLVASVLDQRSLMFGMPKHKKYGYLEILDVTSLILSEGSSGWSEREWRRRLRELTAARMTAMDEDPKGHSRSSSRRSARLSIGPGSTARDASKPRVGFADDAGSARSGRSMSVSRSAMRNDSAPPPSERMRSSPPRAGYHVRNSSEPRIDGMALPVRGHGGYDAPNSGYSSGPAYGHPQQSRGFQNGLATTPERVSSEDERANPPPRDFGNMERMQTPEPVQPPPAFAHSPSSRPAGKPYHSPELRRANSRLSSTTLAQLAKAGGVPPSAYRDELGRTSSDESSGSRPYHGDPRSQGVRDAHAETMGITANSNGSQVLNSPNHQASAGQQTGGQPLPTGAPAPERYMSPLNQSMMASEPVQERGDNPQPSMMPLPPQGPPPAGPLPSLTSSPPHRKPLPQQQQAAGVSGVPGYALHHDPLRQFGPHKATPPQNTQPSRHLSQMSQSSSLYDDASSTASPDYASTRSSEARESIDRPRAGVLKTVGAEQQVQVNNVNHDFNIPEINFGPTVNYAAAGSPRNKTPSPNHNTTPTRGNGHSRNESEDTLRRRSMAWQPGGVTVSPGERSGALTPEQFVQQRAAAASTPMYSHTRTPSGNALAASRGNTPTPPLMKRRSSFDMLAASRVGGHSRSGSAELLGQRPTSQGALHALGGGPGDYSSHLSAREQEHVSRVTGSPLIAVTGGRGQTIPPNGGLVAAIDAREREKQQMKQGISSVLAQNAINQRQQQQERDYRIQQQQHHQLMQHQPQVQQNMYAGMGAPMGQPGPESPSMYFAGGQANVAPSMYSGYGGIRASPGAAGPGGSPGGGRGHMGPGAGPGYGSPQMQNPGRGSPMNHPGAQAYAQGGGFSRPFPMQGQQQSAPRQYGQPGPQQFSPGGGFVPGPQGQQPPNRRPVPQNAMGRGTPQYQGQAF